MFPNDTDSDTKVTLETEATPIAEDLPFHILLLGDWSGRESHQTNSDSLNLHPIEIDRDNFDEVIKNLRVRLDLDFQGNGESILSLSFTELEDFHPDKIFQQLPLFANLRDVRRRLLNKESYNQAAQEVCSWLSVEDNAEETEIKSQTVSQESNQSSTGNILDQILSHSAENVSPSQNQNVEKSELSAFIGKLIEPHLIKTDVAEQSELLMIIDEVISDLMRKILHHPHFQKLESAWRGLYLLVRKSETDVDLKLFLLDATKHELASNLKSVNDLSDSYFYNPLAEASEPWAAICGNYTFGLNVDDVAVLMRLAKLGKTANAPFISYIQPEMFGFNSFDISSGHEAWHFAEDSIEGKLWNTLRSVSEADYLGLALPRFLARLPYGEKTDPTEMFYFEEFKEAIKHEQYLWGNPTFICALLLAQSYRRFGWNMTQNLVLDLDDLPVHLYQEDNETKTKPCAEIVMTQANSEKLLGQGLMPLISYRNDDRVRLGRIQSVAFPFSNLNGKWS